MKLPRLQQHKRGTAYCRWAGKCYYFGKYGTKESEERFNTWLSTITGAAGNPKAREARATILVLAAKFMAHADSYYQRDGKPTGEATNLRLALRTLCQLFGHLPVDEFGPKRLKEVQERMVVNGMCRNTVNSRTRRIRQVFKWGVSEQIVPPEILVGLQSVQGLTRGRTKARETEPVRPVSIDHVDAMRPFVSRQIWGIIQFMLLTGARPGEAISMRWCDIDAERDVWIYRPSRHKTQHKGKQRLIVIGAKAQEVLNEFKGKDNDIVFRPQQAIEEFTVTNYGEDATVRKVGEKYSAFSLASAIRTACEKAFLCPEMLMTRALRRKLPGETSKQRTDRKKQAADWRRKYCWHPNQLRHNAATDARGRAGVDTAQVILGHSSVKTTEIYAETNIDAAVEYARKWG